MGGGGGGGRGEASPPMVQPVVLWKKVKLICAAGSELIGTIFNQTKERFFPGDSLKGNLILPMSNHVTCVPCDMCIRAPYVVDIVLSFKSATCLV